MATNTVFELRHEISSRLREIATCVGMAEDSDLVEELEEVQKDVIALDSLTRIPEELFNLLNSARLMLSRKKGQILVDQDMTSVRNNLKCF